MSKVLKSVFECSEFDVPTTFVILPYEIKKDNETVEKGNIDIESNLNKVDSWISKLTSIINVVDNNVAKVRTSAASQIEGMFKDLKSDKRPAPKFMNKETRGLAEKLVGSINERSTVRRFTERRG